MSPKGAVTGKNCQSYAQNGIFDIITKFSSDISSYSRQNFLSEGLEVSSHPSDWGYSRGGTSGPPRTIRGPTTNEVDYK